MTDPVIYRPGETTIQTHVIDGERCAWTDKTVSEYLAEGFLCLPFDEALIQIDAAQEKRFVAPFVPISEESYTQALECLPPENWRCGAWSLFRMCEYTADNITAHYVATPDGQFFTALRRTTVSYEEIIEEVKGLIPCAYDFGTHCNIPGTEGLTPKNCRTCGTGTAKNRASL